ncbi:MAG: methyltransferase domain-containing protein, partial [Patescibacteria group bacterium]
MAVKKQKIDSPVWKKWANFWRKIKSPWKPSMEEIKFIKSQIKTLIKISKSNGLIHGATPSFRDLLANLGFKVWLLDINQKMIEGMRLIMKIKNPNENIKIGNWLDKPFKKNYFNLVLTDETLDNIAVKNYDRYLRNIRDFLKKDGYFIYGAYCIPDRMRHTTFEELGKLYNKNPKYFRKWKNKCYLWHWVQNEPGIFNRRKWEYNFDNFDKEIKKLYDEEKISKQGLNDLQYHMNYKSINMYRKNLEVFLRKYFKIVTSWSDSKYLNK